MSLLFKIASEPAEFTQILEMNYRTFVEEIPQHEENDTRILIDKFHKENTYIICLKNEKVVGMICVRSNRPFSLDGKIGEVERHLPIKVKNPCEIRLLAVDPSYRNGRVFLGLAQALIRFCLKLGYDAALISGTTRQEKLYGQMGFQPFAYLTGDEHAAFQPMYLTKATFDEGIAGRILKESVNFLPGPVTIYDEVKSAFLSPPISHRSKSYEILLQDVKRKLNKLINSKNVQILHGTGTLANDVIAGQLSLIHKKGLILINGEFGNRLVDHAERWGLAFDKLEIEWGASFTKTELLDVMKAGNYAWLWAVHCETSTGVLNDLHLLEEVCKLCRVDLCLDCISSIGAVPINLERVTFASGVSGKALASYTGLSFVFHREPIKLNKSLPRYLDLGAYVAAEGIPYSQSSNLIAALSTALNKYEHPEAVYEQIQQRYHFIRTNLEASGIKVICDEKDSAPIIMTVEPPKGIAAHRLGDYLYLNGFNVHYESSYLQERNWLQISCINDHTEKDIKNMLNVLIGLCTIYQPSLSN